MSTIKYFGYGAMANQTIMTALLGQTPTFEVRTTAIQGWSLAIQTLDHIPDIPTTFANVEINPRALMRNIWGSNFQSYTIVPSSGGIVYGTLWENLTAAENRLLKEWQLMQWGWYKNVPNVTVSAGGIRVTGCRTECAGDNQPFSQSAPYLAWNNPPLLVEEDLVVAHARKVGAEFRSRN